MVCCETTYKLQLYSPGNKVAVCNFLPMEICCSLQLLARGDSLTFASPAGPPCNRKRSEKVVPAVRLLPCLPDTKHLIAALLEFVIHLPDFHAIASILQYRHHFGQMRRRLAGKGGQQGENAHLFRHPRHVQQRGEVEIQ